MYKRQGKTTLLRIIAGLEFADEGEGSIEFHGTDVTNWGHTKHAPALKADALALRPGASSL